MDDELRALERAVKADPTDEVAAIKLAGLRFSSEGDCRTGLCGFSEIEPGNSNVNNFKPRRTVVCPTCNIKLRRQIAKNKIRAIVGREYPNRPTVAAESLALYENWIDGCITWLLPFRWSRLDHVLYKLIRKLDTICIAWVLLHEGEMELRFDDRPEQALPVDEGDVNLPSQSRRVPMWILPKNGKWGEKYG